MGLTTPTESPPSISRDNHHLDPLPSTAGAPQKLLHCGQWKGSKRDVNGCQNTVENTKQKRTIFHDYLVKTNVIISRCTDENDVENNDFLGVILIIYYAEGKIHCNLLTE